MNDVIKKRLFKLEKSSSGLYSTEFTFIYKSGETKKFVGRKAISFIIETVFGDEEHNIVSITPGETVLDIILQLSNPVPNRDIEDFGGD